MENFVSRFLTEEDTDIKSCARIKLIKKGLHRDSSESAVGTKQGNIAKSLTVSSSSPSCSKPLNHRISQITQKNYIEDHPPCKFKSKSPIEKVKFRNKSCVKEEKILKDMVLLLWKSSTSEKIFTREIYNQFGKIKFEKIENHKEKCLLLQTELTFLKVGKTYPPHLNKIIEDIAILFRVCTFPQTKKAKILNITTQKLQEITKKFTIGKMRKLEIVDKNSNLFQAFLIIIENLFKISDKQTSACELIRSFVSNPGLAIKTIKSIPDLISNSRLTKGIYYIDSVARSFSYFSKSENFVITEGIDSLILLLQEIYQIYQLIDRNYILQIDISKDTVPTVTEEKSPENIIRKIPIKAVRIKNSRSISPKLSNLHSKNNPSVSTKFKQLLEFNKFLDDQSQTLIKSEIEVANSSKVALLEQFYGKSSRNCITPSCKEQNCNSDRSALTDISDRIENTHTEPKCFEYKDPKAEKILQESRFYKKLNNLIEKFFRAKVATEPIELLKFRNNVDYTWKKLNYLKENTGKWIKECLVLLNQSGITYSMNPEIQRTKHNIIVNKLAEENFVDSLLFKYQSELENKILADNR